MLRLRSEVFVVEQNCVYLDLDNIDQKAQHVIAINAEQEVVCCARIVAPGVKYDGASITSTELSTMFRNCSMTLEYPMPMANLVLRKVSRAASKPLRLCPVPRLMIVTLITD